MVRLAYPVAKKITEADLPTGGRLAVRVLKVLEEKYGVKNPNHFRPAQAAARELASYAVPEETLSRFEAIFKRVNGLLAVRG